MSETDASASCTHDGCEREASDESCCYWHREAAGKDPLSDDSPVEEFPDDLSEAWLKGADLSEASLSEADLSNADLSEADLSEAWLKGADLSEADLSNADLSETWLHVAHLLNANLRKADLSEANLYRADLSEANLYRTDLSETATCARADLSDAYLRKGDHSGADLDSADLSGADLGETDLSGARIRRADLSGAHIQKADLSGAGLDETDLTDATLAEAEVEATLERANLTRTDFFNADLRGAAFYGAVTTDTQLNEQTEFGSHYTKDDQSVGDDDDQQARWCLRRIERLAEQNALPGQSREAFLRRRKLRRREASTEGNWGEWTLLTIVQWVMGYGESFARVLRTAVVIVLGSALLYPVWGVETTAGQRLSYPPILGAATAPLEYYPALVDTLLTSLYFSVLTFTTLGFGDLQPVGLGRALATFEAGAGVTLFALLVFVLGRRSTR